MSAENVQPIGQNPVVTPKLQPGQSYLVGRVAEVKRTEKGTYTVINSPARDSFSMPGIHEVQSNRAIGRPGEDIRVLVQLAGYKKSSRDRDGQSQTFVHNILRAVEE